MVPKILQNLSNTVIFHTWGTQRLFQARHSGSCDRTDSDPQRRTPAKYQAQKNPGTWNGPGLISKMTLDEV